MGSLCDFCNAQCCRDKNRPFAVAVDNVDLIRLPEARQYIKRFDDCMAISYKKGKCPFLKGKICSVYEKRPGLCRDFNCIEGYKKGHLSFFLEDHPNIVQLIEKHKYGKTT